MNLSLLRQRIAKRPANKLRDTLCELRSVLPKEIQLIETTEERQGLGKCHFEKLIVEDVLLGKQEFFLRVFEFEAVVNSPLASKPLEKYRETLDENGDPLFNQEPAKQAVLDLLDELTAEPQDDWIPFENSNSRFNRSTLKRHAEQFPDILRKGDRGEWFVIRSHASKYIEE